MSIFIASLVLVAVALLVLIASLLRSIRFAIHLVSQQLEYLGAPLEITNGVLHGARAGYEEPSTLQEQERTRDLRRIRRAATRP